jgi:hypothetical protein
VTIAFLDGYLNRRRGGVDRMRAAGDIASVSADP